jgi:branched-chain amino acid transport system permease protein
MLLAGITVTALVGALVGRYLVLPLKSAPALNTLLITLMFGTALREAVRVFYPQGSNPKPFPRLLTSEALQFGAFSLRIDSLILLGLGAGVIIATHLLITRSKLGLAIRAVAQDEETAKTMGIHYTKIVLITFALGSALAALAGIINGLYYSEINFSMGLNLGVIGFASAIVGGLGNFYGAILGGFLFAALQTIGAVAIPFGSSYKDVFAFGIVIALMAWKPTGLIAEKETQRV